MKQVQGMVQDDRSGKFQYAWVEFRTGVIEKAIDWGR